ncbi:MAG: hypothetical protein LBQ54_05135 [Planctomycetaceae bacterium]|jgi:membrane-bound ClpP family serine protease|nr:hypothetical protein [Planctomycetaceae bacterium]
MDPWIWTVLLLVSALGIGFLELFVPSGGILAVLAVLALIGSIVFGFVQNPVFGGVYLFLLLVGVPLLIRNMIRLWPQTPIGKKILLDPEHDPALEFVQNDNPFQNLLGQTGTAHSPMMPSGQIELDGHFYDATTESIPVEAGTPILVVHVQGNIITVRPCGINDPNAAKSGETPPLQHPVEEELQVEDPFA